ncbi:MMPL family transporter [Pediococcus ethanolidurans]|uniref:MMPL family transporter n=1 Tax=Pediococcus ethanolidurans TaxID=319653 RepID=UPI00345E157C
MNKGLGKLSDFIYKHAVATIVAVLVILGIVGGVAISQGSNFATAGLTIKGTEAQKALNIVDKDFSTGGSGASEKIVFKAKSGKLTDAKKMAAINKLAKKVSDNKQVKVVATPAQQRNLVKNSKYGYATIQYKEKAANVSQASIDKLVKDTSVTRKAGIQTELSGDLTINAMDTGEKSEVYGLIAAIVVLAVTFASLLVAGMPIISAVLGLAVSMLGTFIMSNFISISSADLSLSGMVGLAVGIGYGLFIISRYRQEFKEGYDRQTTLRRAMMIAGKSVVFAGSTVIVALLAMSALGIQFLTVMGICGALSVLTAVLMALTFIPATLVLLGKHGTGEKRNRLFGKLSALNQDKGYGKLVTKYKGFLAIVAVAGLLVAAFPATKINLGLPDDGVQSTKLTARRAYDLMAEGYGKGNSATLVVLVKTSDASKAALAEKKLTSDKNVVSETPAMPGNGKSGHYYMITVTPKYDGNSVKTKSLVAKIRSQSNKNGIPKMLVTGTTAINIDMSSVLMQALPKFAIIIVAFAFVLLMIIFRSLLIPLIAVFGFVLSLLATLGALVFVVQEGHGMSLVGLTTKMSILNFAPVILIGILFGLAMDYEVFLVSRVREIYDKTGDTKKAVIEALHSNGKAVFAAALIMSAVFLGFVFASDPTVKSIGLALSFGIFFDAFIVRMVLVPSMIALFGKANWYLPKWLDKILPHMNLE